MRSIGYLLFALSLLSCHTKQGNLRDSLRYYLGGLDKGIVEDDGPSPAGLDARLRFSNPSQLIEDVSFLSSPECAGRMVGSPGSAFARSYIEKRLSSFGLKVIEHPFAFQRGRKKPKVYQGVNVIAELPGTEPTAPAIAITAHYDHLGRHKRREGEFYAGADDNASGVAALLAMAEYFSKNPPRHTLLFIAFDGEEEIVRGASAFLKMQDYKERIAFNFNVDMISRGDDGYLYAITQTSQKELRGLLKGLQPKIGFQMKYVSTDLVYRALASDHWVFERAKIPFLFLGNDEQPDYHETSDTVEKIDPDFYSAVVDGCIAITQALDGWIPMMQSQPTSTSAPVSGPVSAP